MNTIKKYNWKEIQKFYDQDHTWEELKQFFGISSCGLHKASKRGDLHLRTKKEAYKIALKKGRVGKKHSEETKKKLSKNKLEFLKKNPHRVPYLINHSSKKSYPEIIFENALVSEKICDWTYHFQHGIYQYDFAFVDKKIDVEIDGATHLLPKVIKIDKRRDAWSKSKGWKVIRFSATDVKQNVAQCISILKKHLK